VIWLPYRQAADCARALAREELVDSVLTAAAMLGAVQTRGWPPEILARYAITLLRQVDLYGHTIPRVVKNTIYEFLAGQAEYGCPKFVTRRMCQQHRSSLKHLGLCRAILEENPGFDAWRIQHKLPPIDNLSVVDVRKILTLRRIPERLSAYDELEGNPKPILRAAITPNYEIKTILSRRRENAAL